MPKNTIAKYLLWIAAILIVIFFITEKVLEHWIGKKISESVNRNDSYQIQIGDVDISIFNSEIEINKISIYNKTESNQANELTGEIASVSLEGINLSKAIFNNDFDISELIIINGRFKGRISFSDQSKTKLSPINLHIGRVYFDNLNAEIKTDSTAKTFSIENGNINLFNLELQKNDSITTGIIEKFELKADALRTITSDSMYVLTANAFSYSSKSNSLLVDSFIIHPNYKGYEFASRQKFQSDCIDGRFSKIIFHDLSAAEFVNSRQIKSSYVEISKMDLDVFRDLRETPSHKMKPAFQDLIYNYPGLLKIDSIYLIEGNVVYTEHAIHANHPGRISFENINAKIINVINDSVFNNGKTYFELKSTAQLMGKGDLKINLKSLLFNKDNTFALHGSLGKMNAKDLNPILERNAFIYVTSGIIENMNFNFTANNKKSNGEMTLIYHDFDIAVKNSETDDTTAVEEVIKTWIANLKMLDSNPLPGKEVRTGIIEFTRDPEAFLFNYCNKSILSGIKSSISKNKDVKKKNH